MCLAQETDTVVYRTPRAKRTMHNAQRTTQHTAHGLFRVVYFLRQAFLVANLVLAHPHVHPHQDGDEHDNATK